MPGIFGGIGSGIERYDQLRKLFTATWGECEVFKASNILLGGHSFDNSSLHVMLKLCFAVDGESALYRNATLFAKNGKPSLFQLQNNEVVPETDCKGNIAIFDQENHVLHLATEWTGSFPLYYAKFNGGLVFSSHLKHLAKVISAKADPVGIIEFMRYGYTLAGRTHFKEIHRLLPGQAIVYEAINNRLRVYETSRIWVTQLEGVKIDDIIECVWLTMGDAIRRCLDIDQRHAIMASAGWDSRLLLAAIRGHIEAYRLQGFSHGDVQSRELSIVAHIFENLNIKCHLEPLDNDLYNLQVLQRGFDRVENVIFPYWHRAGVLLSEAGAKSVTAGVFGEVIGGHYGKSMLMGNWEKMAFVASKLLNRGNAVPSKSKEELSAVYDFLRLDHIVKPWYVQPDYWASIPDIREEINADIEKVLHRIEARGIKNADQFIEAYITETRATQYIMAQLLSCRASLDIANIFGDQGLFSLASQIPLPFKIHNTLTQAVLRKYAGNFLYFPTAAILVSAKTPVFIQELTRIFRVVCTNMSWKAHSYTHGYFKPRFLGWDNFEFLRNGKTLLQLVDNFNNDIVDKKAIEDLIEKVIKFKWKGQLHDLSNQLMKIYTTDLMQR